MKKIRVVVNGVEKQTTETPVKKVKLDQHIDSKELEKIIRKVNGSEV